MQPHQEQVARDKLGGNKLYLTYPYGEYHISLQQVVLAVLV